MAASVHSQPGGQRPNVEQNRTRPKESDSALAQPNGPRIGRQRETLLRGLAIHAEAEEAVRSVMRIIAADLLSPKVWAQQDVHRAGAEAVREGSRGWKLVRSFQKRSSRGAAGCCRIPAVGERQAMKLRTLGDGKIRAGRPGAGGVNPQLLLTDRDGQRGSTGRPGNPRLDRASSLTCDSVIRFVAPQTPGWARCTVQLTVLVQFWSATDSC